MPLLTIQTANEHVAPGNYQTTFAGIEEITTEKGKAFRWKFATKDGKTISGLSDAERPPSIKNKTGRWLTALCGKPLQEGVAVNTDDYVGKPYLLIIEPYKDTSRLAMFSVIR